MATESNRTTNMASPVSAAVTNPVATFPPKTPIQQAAEKLAEVALDYTSKASLECAQNSLTELRHVHASIDELRVLQEVLSKDSVNSNAAQFKQINDNLTVLTKTINDQMNTIAAKLDQHHRQERIQAAIALVRNAMYTSNISNESRLKMQSALGFFTYGENSHNNQRPIYQTDEILSTELILRILQLFYQGSTTALIPMYRSSNNDKGQEFITKLVNQIHTLIGIRPTYVENTESGNRVWLLRLP